MRVVFRKSFIRDLKKINAMNRQQANLRTLIIVMATAGVGILLGLVGGWLYATSAINEIAAGAGRHCGTGTGILLMGYPLMVGTFGGFLGFIAGVFVAALMSE